MTLTLTPRVAEAIAEDARRRGMTPEEFVSRDLAARYDPPAAPPPAGKPANAMLALFAEWEAEDPVAGPEDAAARQREGDDLMEAIQANRFTLEGRTGFRALLGDNGADD